MAVSPPTPPVPVARLTKEVYEAFEAGLPRPYAGSQTTPTEAAFLLGIQFVLRKLREDLVL